MLSHMLSWPGTISLVKVDIHVLSARIQVCATTPYVCSAGYRTQGGKHTSETFYQRSSRPAQGTLPVYMHRNADNTWAS